MKKIITSVLLVFMMFSLVLSSCGQNGKTENGSDEQNNSEIASQINSNDNVNDDGNEDTTSQDLTESQGELIVSSKNDKTEQNAGSKASTASKTASASSGKTVSTASKTSSDNPSTPTKKLTRITEDKYYGWLDLVKKGNEKIKTLYQLFATSIADYKFVFQFDKSQGYTADDISLAYEAYREDYPQHFWKSNAYNISTIKDVVVAVEFEDILDDGNKSKLAEKKKQFDSAVNKILSKLNGSMSEIERERIIHDEVIKATRYNITGNELIIYSAYGALCKGEAVCEGYAGAMQHLLREAGIQCIMVKGVLKTNANEAHAWNMARIDGQYYHIDATADDPILKSGQKIVDVLKFNYFNLTTSEIQKTHKIVTGMENSGTIHSIPSATATKYNFFNYYKLIINNFTVTEFAKVYAFAVQHGYDYAHFKVANGDLTKAINFISQNTYDIVDTANAILGKMSLVADSSQLIKDATYGIISLSLNFKK